MLTNSIDEVSEDGTIACLLVNLETSPVALKARTKLAEIEPVIRNTHNRVTVGATMAIDPDNESGEFVTVGDELTECQIDDLRELILEKIAAFSINGLLGETTIVEHSIILEDGAKPVMEPLRRRPLL